VEAIAHSLVNILWLKSKWKEKDGMRNKERKRERG